MKKWLVLDCHNLCHKAFHTMGDLTHNNVLTGVLFGFFGDIVRLQEMHRTHRIIFAFDYGDSFRLTVHPDYKKNRRTKYVMDDYGRQSRKELARQIRLLRDQYLTDMGFNNILFCEGFEADDIMAKVCQDNKEDEFVLVSSDKDLYQLLESGRVTVYSMLRGGKEMTEESFTRFYKIKPSQWAKAKALAGCVTDNIRGLPGVGEKTACAFLNGTLPSSRKVYKTMDSAEGQAIAYRNLKLTSLPYVGCPSFDLVEDYVTVAKWRAVTKELGMNSLHDKLPLSAKRNRIRI